MSQDRIWVPYDIVKQICYHNRRRIELYIEAEVHDVAILYDVLLTLDTELTSLTYSSFRAILDIVIILDNLRSEERRVGKECRL